VVDPIVVGPGLGGHEVPDTLRREGVGLGGDGEEGALDKVEVVEVVWGVSKLVCVGVGEGVGRLGEKEW
jgi:hypothetical protein